MWLIPATSCHSVRASECSTKDCASDSTGLASGREFWLTLSGTPTPRPYSWRGWKTRAWSARLFGAATSPVWTPDLCGAKSDCCAPDCHASPTASQASKRATATGAVGATATGQYRTPCESLPSVSPPWCSLRTSLPGFAEAGFDLSEKNYADWVTRSRSRSLSLRNRLVRATSGSVCLFWHTPCANDSEKRGDAQAGAMLVSQSANWPSPRAEDSESCGNHQDVTDSLTGATMLWTTPTAKHNKRSEGQTSGRLNNGVGNACLATDVELWATPNAMSGGSTSRGGERINEPLLGGQVQQWPTPNSRDHKGSDLNSRNGGASLSHFAETGERCHSPQAQATHDGQTSYETPPGLRRRLNPAFTAWLMGIPWWSIRAEPMPCGAREMAAYRSRLRWHLSNLLGELD